MKSKCLSIYFGIAIVVKTAIKYIKLIMFNLFKAEAQPAQSLINLPSLWIQYLFRFVLIQLVFTLYDFGGE